MRSLKTVASYSRFRWNFKFRIRSKMNAIGGDVLSGIHKAIDIAENEFDGLHANQGQNFRLAPT